MPFSLYPAIDVKRGQVVRLSEGKMDSATVYAEDPIEQARTFASAGSEWLHVVDLDGAVEGKSRNREVIEQVLKSFSGHVQIGGGVRSKAGVRNWIDAGASRVVLGTAALKDPDLVRSAAADFPGRIVVAVDARDGKVATEGWADTSDMAVADLARRFEDIGVAALLFTDIGRDGMLSGVNIEATRELAKAVEIPVIASGGVKDLDDIRQLKKAQGDGIVGVIVGRALYEGRVKLKAALVAAGAD